MKKKNSIFIVWRNYQARVDSMQEHFNYEVFYIDKSFKSKKLKPFEYLFKGLITLMKLIIKRPTVIWVQLPPTPVMYVLYFYKLFFKNSVIISDCHNGMFRKPWVSTPFAITLINKLSNVILVHNSEIYNEVIKNFKISSEKCYVLEDNSIEMSATIENKKNEGKPTVLFPASFNEDEPIDQILKAARSLPDINFVITGNLKRANIFHDISNASSNVIFTGWISKEEYNRLLKNSDIVLGLTKFEGIQLSVANEAVGYEKAMVLSDTKILKELFYKGAIYVQNEEDSLISGITEAINCKNQLEKETKELKIERKQKWLEQAKVVKEFI
ncbi:glycosyltransferase [Neobacillus niacini]|uniref:glycosyltransferase n=1 Tax=Neobacillus niacini TaxID=86668 RepID=UPI0007ABB992|nr:glycosyltransferase [Neobacillus niacini]